MSPTNPTVTAVLDIIRVGYADVPFLALGQTVFWDEPTKAVWKRLLDWHLPEARLLAGVHDTDYFAKTSAHITTDERFLALPHDDGRTRDLWSAAGELSALFGSESIPRGQMYREHGVPFNWLATTAIEGKSTFIAEKTAAWGWRGIVQTGANDTISHDVPVAGIRDALLTQLEWGFAESIASLADASSKERARTVVAEMRRWILDFLDHSPESCCLTDLYRSLLPQFYQLLLKTQPSHLESTASTELFQFHTDVAHLPRFQILSLFLKPNTREIARDAYNEAVAGSGIYTLDGFGVGAIPFDLVVPGRGRSTIRITNRGAAIVIDEETILLRSKGRITTVLELAEVVERQFGRSAALVGKAVTLADMIASEFLVLFHETASGYSAQTAAFNRALRKNGLVIDLMPLVRIDYPTWDALAQIENGPTFALPSHLATAFGVQQIDAADFGSQWRNTIAQQRRVLSEMANIRKLRDLMNFLEGRDHTCWCTCLEQYETALAALKRIAQEAGDIRDQERTCRSRIQERGIDKRELERHSGEDWRSNVQPIMVALQSLPPDSQARRKTSDRLATLLAQRRIAFGKPLADVTAQIQSLKREAALLKKKRRSVERCATATEARQTISGIARRAYLAKLEIVRSAFLTIESLEHTQFRPTAWWLPLVDPSGQWFDAMVAGTRARLEYLN